MESQIVMEIEEGTEEKSERTGMDWKPGANRVAAKHQCLWERLDWIGGKEAVERDSLKDQAAEQV